MGEIDDYKRRENIKGMEKLIEYLLCEDKKEYLLRENERKKEYLLHEDKENKTSLNMDSWICQSVFQKLLMLLPSLSLLMML
jgi:hypothetical protein